MPKSLRFAPKDASFYYSSMNNRWKWDKVVNTKAFKALAESDFGKRAIEVLADKDVGQLKKELLTATNASVLDDDSAPQAIELGGAIASSFYYNGNPA